MNPDFIKNVEYVSTMGRDSMIELLIEDDLNSWNEREDKNLYFAKMLHDGFIGYINWHNQELEDELYDRGLLDD